ncbi:MAG: PD-(D/E)XK nuclease family protein [Anaerolineae bacterium]
MANGLLPEGFLFSQHSLGTFQRCRRRFLLRYVDRIDWPMPDAGEPLAYEEHLRRGRILHQWLERDHLGVPVQPLVAASPDALLRQWWADSRAFDRSVLPSAIREAELPVVVPLGQYRLYARYDLIALDPGGPAVIVDWKTMETRPSWALLASRLQTRTYLYALVAAGAMLTGGTPIVPEQASMLYWFANYPEQPTTIPYDADRYACDGAELLALADTICGLPREAFLPSADGRACGQCCYRSLCERDQAPVVPGADWQEEDIDLNLSLEDAPEIAF